MLDWAKRQSISTPFTASPSATGTPAAGDWYAGRLDVNIVAGAWTLTLIDSWTKITWVNSTVAEEWFGWIPQATATPPAVYDLPLVAGISNVRSCKYWKNQFGEVGFIITCGVSSSVLDNSIIATLPEGYRPQSPIVFGTHAMTSDGQRIGGLSLDVFENGDMRVWSLNRLDGNSTFWSSGCFVAA